MSGIVNKIKEAVHGDKSHHSSGAPEGTHGPHNSRVANAADPRVDSDRDNSRTMGAGSTTTTGRTAGHGEMGSAFGTGTSGHTMGTGHTMGGTTGSNTEGMHGPHSSRLANAADPRVDSDRDGSRNMGASGGFGSTGNNFGSGTGSGVTGMMGTHGTSAGSHGPHNSRMANAADPRVDSDRDGRGALGTGPGPASNTAGPHSGDMMNKVDPRVDSDLDGSRTMGGNKTYQ